MSEQAAAAGKFHIGLSPMVKKGLVKGFKISRAVRAGDWFFSNGQMDAGEGAKVLNPNDILSQTITCMRMNYEVMAKADCRLSELAQIQVFYLGDSIADEEAYRERILEEFPECRDALLVMTRVPSFATLGSELEIDAIAVKGDRRACVRDEAGVVRGVRRGDWVFANSRVRAGASDICEELDATLAQLACGLSDVCRLYAYYPADLGVAERLLIESRLAAAFRDAPPAFHATWLPKNSTADFAVELEVVANSNPATEKLRYGRTTAPTAGLDWPFVEALRCGEAVFSSGQFPVDDAQVVLHPGDIANQSRAVMRRVAAALQQAGAEMSDLVKIKTYFEGSWDLENWFDNLSARMESLSDPGPASTGLEGLPPVREGTLLSVDGIAILDIDHRT